MICLVVLLLQYCGTGKLKMSVHMPQKNIPYQKEHLSSPPRLVYSPNSSGGACFNTTTEHLDVLSLPVLHLQCGVYHFSLKWSTCSSNATKWIRFSSTPSIVNRTQDPHRHTLSCCSCFKSIIHYYWTCQRVRLSNQVHY